MTVKEPEATHWSPGPISPARDAAAAALRRLGHAVVAHDCEPALLERITEFAQQAAASVEQAPPRVRPADAIKRRLREPPPADGQQMSHFRECVVSGPANPMGVALQVRRDGDEAVAALTLGPAFEGAPQRAHGGVVAAVFDDVMGYVLVLERVAGFTGRLTVHYRAAVPIGVEVHVRARLRERDGRKLRLTAEMTIGDEVVCDAEALFITIAPPLM